MELWDSVYSLASVFLADRSGRSGPRRLATASRSAAGPPRTAPYTSRLVSRLGQHPINSRTGRASALPSSTRDWVLGSLDG